MERRRFISVAGMAALGIPLVYSTKLAGMEPQRWETDGAGSLGRIGLLTPDDDPVPESEMWTMVTHGISIHTARVLWNHDAAAFAQPPKVDDATEQLVRLKPGAIVYAFTSSSYALGAAADNALRLRLEKRAGAFQ